MLSEEGFFDLIRLWVMFFGMLSSTRESSLLVINAFFAIIRTGKCREFDLNIALGIFL